MLSTARWFVVHNWLGSNPNLVPTPGDGKVDAKNDHCVDAEEMLGDFWARLEGDSNLAGEAAGPDSVAAQRIQHCWRCHLDYRKGRRVVAAKAAEDAAIEDAGKLFAGFERRAEYRAAAEHALRIHAARIVQRWWRRRQDYRKGRRVAAAKAAEDAAIEDAGKLFAGFERRAEYRAAAEHALRIHAARIVQRWWRRRQAQHKARQLSIRKALEDAYIADVSAMLAQFERCAEEQMLEAQPESWVKNPHKAAAVPHTKPSTLPADKRPPPALQRLHRLPHLLGGRKFVAVKRAPHH